METKKSIFLSAEWRKLILANYPIDPEILTPYLPKGTELDFYNDICYVSLVGFMFLNTKVMGVKIPFHQNFEEFNLRFYVKRKTETGYKRGVVFIKEIVPKPAIAYTARLVYREPYVTMRMKHEIKHTANQLSLGYYFQHNGFWNKITATCAPTALPFEKGTEADFITEHYWGYNAFSEAVTMEYEVEHPSWNMYEVKDFNLQLNIKSLYGEQFVPYLTGRPLSVLVAEGSEIVVRKGNKLSV